MTPASKAVVIAAAAVLVVVALALARDPSPRLSAAAAQGGPDISVPAADVDTTQPVVITRSSATRVPATVGARVQSRSAVEAKPAPNVMTSPAPAIVPLSPAPVASAAAGGESSVKRITSEPSANARVATPGLTVDRVSEPPVTITGCLETTGDDGRFRLTDTEGAEAPKARGWRSGFLKKRSAPVELVDVPTAVALRKYVGQRVAATGVLMSRELHVRSFRSAGTACE